MAGTPGLGVLDCGLLLVGDRRVSGQLVEVGDDVGQHPKHAGAVERDVFRLGVGLGPQVHHDQFPAVQAFQPLAAPARGLPAGQKVGQALGRGRLLAWFVGSVRPALLTVATGDLAGVPTGAETRGGRDLADGQTRLMGFGAGPDSLSLGPFRAFRA